MNRPYRSSMGRFVLCPCSPVLEDHYYIYCPRNPWSQSGRRKGGLRWEGYAENDTLPPNFPGASLHQVLGFYRAMLCIRGTSHEPVSVCVCVCISVCPPQVGVLLNRLNVGSHKKPHDNPGSLFFGAKDLREIRPGSPPTRAPNAGGVGQNRRLSTNNGLYLENGKR